MERISAGDRAILREIAQRKYKFAHSARNEEILSMWQAQAEGRRESPTVRLLFSNFTNEVITSRLRCEGQTARRIEAALLDSLVGRELFDDDTPVTDTFDVRLFGGTRPFGTSPDLRKAKDSIGFHIEPITDDIEADFDKFCGGSFRADPEGTRAWCAYVDEVIGNILPSRMVGGCLTGPLTNPLVMLISMETYYLAMYDAPDTLHKIMDMATRVHESYYDYLEREKLLLPNVGPTFVAQESFGFTNELPADKAEKTTDVWGFLESQETTAVAPETYGEFVYPYLDRLVRRYGLLSYGCCERVDNLWEDYLSKWPNLRKLSVSPFNDERKVGDYLRGTRVVYYSKPRAEYVTNPGPLDEDALRVYFRGVAEAASGCLLEVAQREVGTIFGDFERGRRYVQIARETINDYWKP